VPEGSKIDGWNLDTPAVWWYFERPLPIYTAIIKGVRYPLYAISIGRVAARGNIPEPVMSYGKASETSFLIDAWTRTAAGDLVPTTRCFWESGMSIGELWSDAYRKHQATYGPRGPFRHEEHGTPEAFAELSVQLARFMMSGIAWMAQKVVVEREQVTERHRRKEFQRVTGRKLDALKVIHMRKVVYPRDPEGKSGEDAGRTYTCQWHVDGHWRLAKVGPGRVNRRLTYVHPYVKGPDGKPFRVPRGKVIAVDR
jgi:hypothetical protein